MYKCIKGKGATLATRNGKVPVLSESVETLTDNSLLQDLSGYDVETVCRIQ